MLAPGTPAPDFSLPDQNGTMHSLAEYRGRTLVLYFYPKDSTPGCTKQACGYSALVPEYAAKDAVVVGISRDSVKSHKNFETKQSLGITLLSDVERTAIEAYDVWKEKTLYGKKSMGVVRTTYVIGPDGVIVAANDKVKAADDPAKVLAGL